MTKMKKNKALDTIVEEWRQQEREGLLELYQALEDAARIDGRIGVEAMTRAAEAAGTSLRSIVQGEHSFVMTMADCSIEIANDDLRRDAVLSQIAGWRKQIERPSRWNMHRAVDDHIIHMHLRRIKGADLPELIANRDGRAEIVPYEMDIVESDLLSLHIIAGGCSGYETEQASTGPEGSIDIVRKAIHDLRDSGYRWTRLPRSMRRGIHLTADHSMEGLSITGNHVAIPMTGLPASFLARDHIGRPLHDIVDMSGFRHDDLKIRSVIRKADSDKLVFVIDRHAPPLRRRLDLT